MSDRTTYTLSPYTRWDNYCSASSDPLGDVALAVAMAQLRGGRDPELISIRVSAWAALLRNYTSNDYRVKRGLSLAQFRDYTGAREVKLFPDDSPAGYDVRVVAGEFAYEICGAVDDCWRQQ